MGRPVLFLVIGFTDRGEMSNRWEPSASELDILAQYNTMAAARMLGRSKDAIVRVRRERGIANPYYGADATPAAAVGAEANPLGGPYRLPEYEPHVWQFPPDARLDSDLWSTFEAAQAVMARLDTERTEIDVEIKGNEPVLIVWVSDLHIGHTSCDMGKLRRDLETIRNTPNMYCILGGDLTDNVTTAVAGRGMFHEQLMPGRAQKMLIDDAVTYLGREKIIGMVLGNHDAWSISADDFDPVAYWAHKVGCGYLGAYGFVNVSLGNQGYRILASHMFRMKSSFNKTHAAKRLMDFMGDADAVFVGHTHDSAAESTHVRQRRVFFGQAGSYLRSSRYSKAGGFTPSTAEMPGVVLYPDRHKVLGFHDGIEDGRTHLLAIGGKG